MKCIFLGKIVDRRGVRLDTSTTDAILKMPAPTDKSQLRSFLDHISFVSRHIPDLRSARAPLDYLIYLRLNLFGIIHM